MLEFVVTKTWTGKRKEQTRNKTHATAESYRLGFCPCSLAGCSKSHTLLFEEETAQERLLEPAKLVFNNNKKKTAKPGNAFASKRQSGNASLILGVSACNSSVHAAFWFPRATPSQACSCCCWHPCCVRRSKPASSEQFFLLTKRFF